MPIGNPSLQNFQASAFNVDTNVGIWKAKQDANSAIASNIAGATYVYQNSPAAMSVLVDPAFNLPLIGAIGPYLLGSGTAPVTVSLVAPGSNSY
jgi:hypothetical protein